MSKERCIPLVLMTTILLVAALVISGIATWKYGKTKEKFLNTIPHGVGGTSSTHPHEATPNPFVQQLNTKGWPPDLTESEKVQGLYAPIICRPPFNVHQPYDPPCEENANGLFSNQKMQTDCNPTVSAKYYANRPIVNPNDYHSLLEFLFNNVTDPFTMPTKDLVHPQMFSESDDYSELMKFVMKKIDQGVETLKPFVDYSKIDTWGGEQFAFLNEKLYAFTREDTAALSEEEQARKARYGEYTGPVKYNIAFTLYNTLRSISTDVILVVLGEK